MHKAAGKNKDSSPEEEWRIEIWILFRQMCLNNHVKGLETWESDVKGEIWKIQIKQKEGKRTAEKGQRETKSVHSHRSPPFTSLTLTRPLELSQVPK